MNLANSTDGFNETGAELERPTFPRLLFIAAILFVVVIVGAGIWLFLGRELPPNPPIRISRETTYITEPVKPNGDIDYVRYFDELTREGVTPENNAVVPLIKAVGTDWIYAPYRAETLRKLGIEPLPDDGEYFIEFKDWLEREQPDSILLQNEEELNLMLEFAQKNPWSEIELPELASWLDDVAPSLELVREASKREMYYDPMISQDDRVLHTNVTSSGAVRPSIQAVNMQAMRDIKNGRFEDAVSEVVVLRQLAVLYTSSPSSIERLIAITLSNSAADCEYQLVISEEFSNSQLSSLANKINTLPKQRPFSESAYYERLAALDWCANIRRRGSSTMALLIEHFWDAQETEKFYDRYYRTADWSRATIEVNTWFDRFEAALDIESFLEKERVMNRLEEDLNSLHVEINNPPTQVLRSPMLQGELVGKSLSCFLLPALTVIHRAEANMIARDRMSRIVLAIALYERENDAHPELLDQLVPDYLESVPLDPYSDKPFVYARNEATFTLYAIGANLVDDGGIHHLTEGDVVATSPPESWQQYLERHIKDKSSN